MLLQCTMKKHRCSIIVAVFLYAFLSYIFFLNIEANKRHRNATTSKADAAFGEVLFQGIFSGTTVLATGAFASHVRTIIQQLSHRRIARGATNITVTEDMSDVPDDAKFDWVSVFTPAKGTPSLGVQVEQLAKYARVGVLIAEWSDSSFYPSNVSRCNSSTASQSLPANITWIAGVRVGLSFYYDACSSEWLSRSLQTAMDSEFASCSSYIEAHTFRTRAPYVRAPRERGPPSYKPSRKAILGNATVAYMQKLAGGAAHRTVPVYIVSASSSRRQRLSALLAKQSKFFGPVTWVQAVDTKSLCLGGGFKANTREDKIILSCALSHGKAAWQLFQDGVDVGLVIEDDVAFHFAAGPMIEAARDWLANGESDLHLLSVGYIPPRKGDRWFYSFPYGGPWRALDVVWATGFLPWGLQAYLLTRKGADIVAGVLHRPRAVDVRLEINRRGIENTSIISDHIISKLLQRGVMRPQVRFYKWRMVQRFFNSTWYALALRLLHPHPFRL